MSTDFEDVDDAELEEVEDPGFVGGGGPAATIFGEDDDLDERGDDLSRVDEEDA
jgi:hypothetical protein